MSTLYLKISYSLVAYEHILYEKGRTPSDKFWGYKLLFTFHLAKTYDFIFKLNHLIFPFTALSLGNLTVEAIFFSLTTLIFNNPYLYNPDGILFTA